MYLVIKLSLSFFWQSVGTSHCAHRQAKAQCSALPTPPIHCPKKYQPVILPAVFQISPALYGLLGTVVGYLLGKDTGIFLQFMQDLYYVDKTAF